MTDNSYDKLLRRYTPAQLDRAKMFYEKANEFIRRFVAAGGILKEGSDPPRGMAALLMHQALVMDVEAGVPPMTAIQAATLNSAKTFKIDKDYGSIERGKVADLFVVDGDPLKDIWMTQNVKTVIMDGKVVDREFRKYKNPIPSFYTYQTLPLDLDISPRDRDRRRRPDDPDGERQGHLAAPSGLSQRPAAADAIHRQERTEGDPFAGGDRNGRALTS